MARLAREHAVILFVSWGAVLALVSQSLTAQLLLAAANEVFARAARLGGDPYRRVLGYGYVPLLLLVPAVDYVSTLYLEGVLGAAIHAATTLARLVNLLAVFTLLTLAVHPMRLASLLEQVGLPRTLSLGVTVALISLPLMERELRQVLEAQASRGISVDSALGKVYRLRAILQPVIIRGVEHGFEIAQTLVLRGYARAPLRRSPWLVAGLIASAAAGGATALLIPAP